VAFWGLIRTLQSDVRGGPPPPPPPSLHLPANNWRSAWRCPGWCLLSQTGLAALGSLVVKVAFWSFRHLACYSLPPARTGYMACQAKRLCMLVSGWPGLSGTTNLCLQETTSHTGWKAVRVMGLGRYKVLGKQPISFHSRRIDSMWLEHKFVLHTFSPLHHR
jgi:hypothetical protein